MKKEILIFSIIFLFLAIAMHNQEWISYPLEHLKSLPYSSAYGFGSLHPLIFTFIIYLLLFIPRFIVKLIIRKK